MQQQSPCFAQMKLKGKLQYLARKRKSMSPIQRGDIGGWDISIFLEVNSFGDGESNNNDQ